MANRFFSPNQQFADATGLPYAGGSLSFYASGTSTPLATYSDSALTIANTNPVVLDSAGRAGNIFLQNLAYKVVLADANNNQIWTDDPVYSSDFSTAAQFFSGSGNPNGVVAGTAGSATIKASSYWDFTNSILYVCTTTGNAASAVWTAVNASAASQVNPAPSGRLTLTSGTPVLSSDVIGATAVIYTPYIDNNIPIYNGSSVVANAFSEMTLTLAAQHAADTLYDVFVFNNSGVLTLVTGPAWANNTAGSCSRGTGAGTTQLTRINGHWFNAVSITGARNGASTFNIAANLATYLGTIYIDHTAGQVTCHVTFGQNRKWGVWNAFNRVPVILKSGSSGGNWGLSGNRAFTNQPSSYTASFWNVGSGTTVNGSVSLIGLIEESAVCTLNTGLSGSGAANIGIGLNGVTNAVQQGTNGGYNAGTAGSGYQTQTIASYTAPLALGLSNFVSLEQLGSGAVTGITGEAGNCLYIQYRG